MNHLSELIADPPAILIDERQKLFFYRGVPVLLRPVSFSYMLLLAQTPRELVMRERSISCLWPGEINFEGTNKPYERQITDQKRKLLDEIRKGIAGRVEIREGEMESLIATRHKMGYMLNFDRENVLILRKGDFPVVSFLFLLAAGSIPLRLVRLASRCAGGAVPVLMVADIQETEFNLEQYGEMCRVFKS